MPQELLPIEVRDNGVVELSLAVPPAINYALVHNRVPLVRLVAVRNTSDRALIDLIVTLRLVSDSAELTETWSRGVAELPAGRSLSWDDFPELRLAAESAARVEESRPVG